MKKYNKPEIKFEDITVKEVIAALNVSSGKVATYENVDQDSWSSWQELF